MFRLCSEFRANIGMKMANNDDFITDCMIKFTGNQNLCCTFHQGLYDPNAPANILAAQYDLENSRHGGRGSGQLATLAAATRNGKQVPVALRSLYNERLASVMVTRRSSTAS